MATTIESAEQLERELYELLRPVELVCEADIPSHLIDAAEELIRPLIDVENYDRMSTRFPASTVTYLVHRGSERYSENKFWPHVGVVNNTSEAGQSFIRSLKALSLPDFEAFVEQAAARRYVAPILIHGALPSSVANRLLERVEDELRRGLVSGDEARTRMLSDPELESVLGRPAARLLSWCPQYAVHLLDAIIEHIEDPAGAGLERLPIHLQHALQANAARHRGLRRLTLPTIEFQLWSGFGPEVVGVASARWNIEIAGTRSLLGNYERVEIPPKTAVFATADGRRVALGSTDEVLFFDHNGRFITFDAKLPESFVVVLPSSWSFRTVTGTPLEEEDEGVPMSGVWSRYRSCSLTVPGNSTVCVGPSDEHSQQVVRRAVGERVHARLHGAVVDNAVSSIGGSVYSSAPFIIVPGSAEETIGAWFTPVGEASKYVALERVGDVFDVSGLVTTGAVSGMLQLRRNGPHKSEALPLTVVPGLDVNVPGDLLGPADTVVIHVVADSGVLSSDAALSVGPGQAEFHLDIAGLPARSVAVVVPRVQWALRTQRLSRVDLAAGAIGITHADLVKEPMWLNVRCGRASQVGLELAVAGSTVQRVQAKTSRAGGHAEHHHSIALDQLRDTIRRHPLDQIELVVVVDGRRFVAVSCEGAVLPAPATRTWSPEVKPSAVVVDKFKDVPWLQGQLGPHPRDTKAERELMRMSGDEGVVTFLRTVGRYQRNWKMTEFPYGPSGLQWKTLMTTGNTVWRIDGVRLREFTGDLNEKLRRWSHTHRERLRREPDSRRKEIENWLIGRAPHRWELRGWQHHDWLEASLPSGNTVSCQWLPGTVIFHCLALIAGQEESAPIVASAVDLEPAMVLEVLAFLMQALQTGRPIWPPVIEPSPADDIVKPADAAAELPALDLTRCALETTESSIILLAPEPTKLPMFRLSRSGKPLALLSGTADGQRITIPKPLDIHGMVQLSTVTTGELRSPGAGIDVHLPATLVSMPPGSVSVDDPTRLNEARLDATLDQIVQLVQVGGLARSLVDELFDDEHAAALALSRLDSRLQHSQTTDRVAIAVLPSAMLFTKLAVPTARVGALKSNLMFAAIAPRQPVWWKRLGWPSEAAFHSGSQPLDVLRGFGMRLARKHNKLDLPTGRYGSSTTYADAHVVDNFVQLLSPSVPSGQFLDLIVATHRMLTVENLIDEAMRMLLDSHRIEPAATTDAVLVGVALFLAAQKKVMVHPYARDT